MRAPPTRSIVALLELRTIVGTKRSPRFSRHGAPRKLTPSSDLGQHLPPLAAARLSCTSSRRGLWSGRLSWRRTCGGSLVVLKARFATTTPWFISWSGRRRRSCSNARSKSGSSMGARRSMAVCQGLKTGPTPVASHAVGVLSARRGGDGRIHTRMWASPPRSLFSPRGVSSPARTRASALALLAASSTLRLMPLRGKRDSCARRCPSCI